MIKKILIFFLLITIYSQISYSQINNDYLKFIGITETEDSSKISYSLKKDPKYEGDEIFIVEMINNKNIRKTLCTTDLKNLMIDNEFSDSTIFQKITCEFKKDRGKNTFIGKVTDSDYHILNSQINTIYFYNGFDLEMNFKDLENEKTLIEIEINSDYKEITLKQTIPKEVIRNLNDENKNSLIETDFKYEILKADPLIAWNIEKTPTKINYTINKKISDNQKEKFELELERSSIYKKLEYALIILIIFIVILIFKPTISKKIKNKK